MNIDELEKIARAATEGPWEVEVDPPLYDCGETFNVTSVGDDVADGVKAEDAAHIAAFNPQTALELIERMRRAEAAAAEAETLVHLAVTHGSPAHMTKAIHCADAAVKAWQEVSPCSKYDPPGEPSALTPPPPTVEDGDHEDPA